MGRSNNSVRVRSVRVRGIVALDRAALVALATGLALYVAPFWKQGRLRWAFALTLISTLLHVYTSHKRRPSEVASSFAAAAAPDPEGTP